MIAAVPRGKEKQCFSTQDLWYYFNIVSQKSRRSTQAVNITVPVLTGFSIEELPLSNDPCNK